MAEVEAATKQLLDTRGGNFASFHFLSLVTSMSMGLWTFQRRRQGFGDCAFSCCRDQTTKQSLTSHITHGSDTGLKSFQLLNCFNTLTCCSKANVLQTLITRLMANRRQVLIISWRRQRRERKTSGQRGRKIVYCKNFIFTCVFVTIIFFSKNSQESFRMYQYKISIPFG